MAGWADSTSAIASIVAALVALVTILTVYAAAIQILSQKQQYELGVSHNALGPWRSKVVRRVHFLRLKQISTPKLLVKRLVQRKWSTTINFPHGIYHGKDAQYDTELQPAEATWVNFLQAIGISAEENTDDSSYTMQIQQEIVNGIVPMRWNGSELVAICAALGFQNFRDPKLRGEAQKTPMPLPMIWSGPLGWIYFRSSSDGCVAEFKRRQIIDNQFSPDIHMIMNNLHQRLGSPSREVDITRRLWQCLDGLSLGDSYLYLGGQDRSPRDKRRIRKQPKIDPFEGLPFNIDALDRVVRETANLQDQDITNLLFPDALSEKNNKNDSASKLRVMARSPGLLSVATNGEIAYIYGLDISENACQTLDRVYVPESERDQLKYPYTLGLLCFGHDIADMMKKAALRFVPDSFFCCPSFMLYQDIRSMWLSVRRELKTVGDPDTGVREKELFPLHVVGQPELQNVGQPETRLRLILKFCNACWNNMYHGYTTYTVEDIQLFDTASQTLQHLITSSTPNSNDTAMDLVWAMLASPGLFTLLLNRLRKTDVTTSLATLRLMVQNPPDSVTPSPTPTSSPVPAAGWPPTSSTVPGQGSTPSGTTSISSQPSLSPTLSPTPASQKPSFAKVVVSMDGLEEEEGTFQVPLMSDGQYEGVQVFAAFCHVIVTHLWMKKRWIQSVSDYTFTIPNSVKMC